MFSLSQRGCAGALLDEQFLRSCHDGAAISQSIVDTHTQYRRLEANKSLAYQILTEAGIAVPPSRKFSNIEQLKSLLHATPAVIKFDSQCVMGYQTCFWPGLDFTAANLPGHTGIVQQLVSGQEFTVTVAVGTKNWVPIGSAVDYKRRFNGHVGPNTFGMGSVAPCRYLPAGVDTVIDRVVDVLQARFRYQGLLSCQFIAAPDQLWFLEYNTRICDPEFQSMAQRLDHSFVDTLRNLYHDRYLDVPNQLNVNAVTVSLIHQDWPAAQSSRELLSLSDTRFRIARMNGSWDANTYWGTVTNSGTQCFTELANQIYDFLRDQPCHPYTYRTDIGQ